MCIVCRLGVTGSAQTIADECQTDSGALLSEAFGNYTTLVTNGSGIYATTAQEDNATLEGTSCIRAHPLAVQ